MRCTRIPLAGIAFAILLVSAGPALADAQRGIDLLKAGQYADAVNELQAAADQNPDSDVIQYSLGLALTKVNRIPDAIPHLQRAVELKGNQFEYLQALGSALYSQKDYAGAASVLARAEGLAPSDEWKFSVLSMRGLALAAMQNWQEAMADIQNALAIKKSGPLLVQLGRMQLAQGRTDDAIVSLRQAVAIEPSPEAARAVTEALLATAASKQGDQAKPLYGEALENALRFQQMQPGFEANALVGQAALGAGAYPQAEQALKAALAEKPDFCPGHLHLGMTYAWMERWPESEEHLTHATQCGQQPPIVWQTLGYVDLKQNKLQDALQAYQKANELQPTEATQKAIETLQARLQQGQGGAQQQP